MKPTPSRSQKKNPPLTQAKLKKCLAYDPETGIFIRLASSSKRRAQIIGQPAGTFNAYGYRLVGIGQVQYLAHRLAWLYMTGEWPPSKEIDHRDTDRANNRWSNLRRASRAQNTMNKPLQSNNSVGFKCVSPCGNRYRAYIVLDGKQKHLGVRATPQEAHALYVAAAQKYFGEFARAA